jgi:hypothetical protein
MNRKLQLPDALNQTIDDALADLVKQGQEVANVRAAQEAQVAELEALASELSGRLPALNEQVATSEQAANEVVVSERRLTAINKNLDEARAAVTAAPGLNLTKVLQALSQTVDYYREALPAALLEDLAPYGVESHMVAPLASNLHALQILTIIRDRVLSASAPGASNVGRIVSFLRRARRGQLNLNADESDS